MAILFPPRYSFSLSERNLDQETETGGWSDELLLPGVRMHERPIAYDATCKPTRKARPS